MIKILAFAGSTRKDSFNKKILTAAIAGVEKDGVTVTRIDLHDYRLPLYDGDLEENEGLPENAKRLRELFMDHQGLLLALPEYNSSMSAVFKNTIDWVSRNEKGEGDLSCFKGKVAGLISASPGNLGGIRGLVHVRAMLENIQVQVIPEQHCVSKADSAFDDQGNVKDERTKSSLEKIGVRLADVTKKMHSELR